MNIQLGNLKLDVHNRKKSEIETDLLFLRENNIQLDSQQSRKRGLLEHENYTEKAFKIVLFRPFTAWGEKEIKKIKHDQYMDSFITYRSSQLYRLMS